jgi:RNA 2',3'-cyclic 3'-phosphodiesterase
MRLFTAIDLPSEIVYRLERLLMVLRPEALIKWSPLDNLHITTKFIGEWPDDRLEELDEALASLGPRDSFEITIQDLGWYPNERSPRVLWAGVHAGDGLAELANATEQAVARLGIARDARGFSPHLTLARIKNPVPLQNLRRKVAELQPAIIGSFLASHFTLFRSDPGSNASIYCKLREYKFESALAAS